MTILPTLRGGKQTGDIGIVGQQLWAKQGLASTAGANLRGNPSGLLSSGGRALQDPLLGEMNTALGYDFSQVRIHADGEAERLAGQLGARAVTVGQSMIQMSGGFYGHPGGTKSKEEWISFLNKHRGEDAKLKAFLSDDAQRFDWDMLKRLMETK
jgi:hypothetical protein